MRRRFGLCLLVLTLPLGWPSVATAWQATAEKDLDKVARDQRAIGDRLVRLEAKMGRLSERLESEGKTRAASLLRKASEALRGSNLRNEIDQLAEDLEQGHLQAIERQTKLLERLEEIYAILLDRNDLEKLNETLDKIREGITGLENLAGAEGKLREETESRTASQSERLERLRQQLEELIARQRALEADRTGLDAAGGEDRPRSVRERLRGAEQAQREALQANLEQIDTGLAELSGHLDEAIAHQEPTARGLERLANRREADQDVLDALGTEQEAARKAAGDAGRALEGVLGRFRSEGRDSASLDAVAAALGEATAAMDESDRQLGRKEIDTASAESARALAALRQARDALESTEVDATGKARDAQRRADQARNDAAAALASLAARSPEDDPSAAAESASVSHAEGALAQAEDAAREAGDKLDADQALGAANRQKEAASALREAGEALDEAIAARQGAMDEEARRQAGQQDLVRADAERMAGEVERLDKALAEGEREAARSDLERAAGAMAEARRALAEQRSAEASSSQADASQALEEARRALEQAGSNETPEEAAARTQAFEELARRQQEIEQATEELMHRLQDLKGNDWQESAEQGRQAMERARGQLQQEQDEPAIEQEREAESRLREAADKLREDERNYESLRQEELFFRVKEEITKLRDRQGAVLASLDELRSEQEAQGGRLRRAARRRARDVGGEEKAISTATGEVGDKIREDGSQVFTYVLERNIADLDEVASGLDSRNPQIDEYTVGVASSVRRRFDELLAVLDEEMQRRREAAQQQQPEQQQPDQAPDQQPKPRLVPPVAELLMIRRLEVGVREEIRIFLAEKGGQEFDDMDFEILQRLGHDHSSLTELFDKLVEAAQQGAPEGPAPDSESEGAEGGTEKGG